MKNNLPSLKEWYEHLLLTLTFRKYFVFKQIKLDVEDFESDGLILDIGGGGEGVIGRLKGQKVVAIDLYQEELDEAPDGPQKIVMDARALTFPNDHFGTVTAFFSMMYMKTRQDHQTVMKEAFRVLKPGGHLYLWDVDISKHSATKKMAYFVPLHYRVGEYKKGTGYGAAWPDRLRDEAYYLDLAREAGFHHLATERKKHVLKIAFSRP